MKARVVELFDHVSRLEAVTKKNLPLRVALVFYRDIDDETATSDPWRIKVLKFTRDIDIAKHFLTTVAPGGLGRDIPEDVEGGLAAVLGLRWRASFRLVVHIADAPGHGAGNHDAALYDAFPQSGGDMCKYVSTLAARGIDYCFVKLVPDAVAAGGVAQLLKSSMDIMAAQLAAAYKAGNPHGIGRMQVMEVRTLLLSESALILTAIVWNVCSKGMAIGVAF